MLAATAVAVLAGAASVIVAVIRPGSAPASHSAAPSGTASLGAGAQFADADAVSAFMAAGASDITAVTTYDYRRLDDALSSGLAVTTGAYRSAYRQAMTGTLATSARSAHVVHQFQVMEIGIGGISANGRQAKVLVFGRQVTTDRTSAAGGDVALVTLCATMQRQGDDYLISNLAQDASAGLPPGSTDLATAAQAARAEVGNLLTYRRSQFGADLARTLAGATGPLRSQLQHDAAATRTAMTRGKYDLGGAITALAVKSADGTSATFLLAADARKISASGATIGSTAMRYVVTVVKSSGTWVAAQIDTLTSG